MPARPPAATPPPPSTEVCIAGLLVQALPQRIALVAEAVSRLDGAEVRVASEVGKLVVVCECPGGDGIAALLEQVRNLPGVLNVALVYQHTESAEALDEELSDESHPPRIH